MVTLAVISVLYGGLLAIGQTDIKRIIAFSSISHFGVIVLGIFALTSQGTSGSTFYMVSHGLSTAALFIVGGFLIARRGSRRLADFGGVQKPAPILAGFRWLGLDWDDGMMEYAEPGRSGLVRAPAITRQLNESEIGRGAPYRDRFPGILRLPADEDHDG